MQVPLWFFKQWVDHIIKHFFLYEKCSSLVSNWLTYFVGRFYFSSFQINATSRGSKNLLNCLSLDFGFKTKFMEKLIFCIAFYSGGHRILPTAFWWYQKGIHTQIMIVWNLHPIDVVIKVLILEVEVNGEGFKKIYEKKVNEMSLKEN